MILQHCIQELQSWQPERISGHIEQVLRNKNDNLDSCSQHLSEIVESLGLVSNQELLKESISVEKEREKLEAKSCLEEVDQITQIVDLMDLIHDYLIRNGYFGTMNGVSIPWYFRCPLSLDFMLDPVIVDSGQTFERSSIQKWLNQGLRNCPKTRQYLSHTNLIPNYTVKALIANWFQENNLNPPNSSDNINGDDLSTQDVIHTDSFCCSVPSSESMSGEISSSMCRGVDPAKSNHRSPVHSYAHSRTQSVTSAISSFDYMPSSTSELSKISDPGEKVGEIMSEPSSTK